MSRIYGYAPIGARCEVSRSGKKRKNITVIAAVSLLGGLLAPMVMDGGLTSEAFAAWVEAFLVPELQAGDVVVMDNLRAHLSAKAREAIEQARATILFLPTYSPDFNPIELVWAKMKAIFRELGPANPAQLDDAIIQTDDALTDAELWRMFHHAGIHYQPHCK